MHIYSFEKLDVWQLAREFATNIYLVTNSFPSNEQFGLTSQIRRATVSIAANLAEGSSRVSSKDQAHFYHIAYSSAIEVLSHLLIATDLNFMNENQLQELRTQLEEITVKINSIRKATLKK